MGIDPSQFPIDEQLNPDQNFKSKLKQAAWAWIKDHPFEYLELIPIKFWTLVRPDYREDSQFNGSKALFYGAIQTAIALIFPFWIFLKWISKDDFWGPLGVAPFALLFSVPFLLTEADPRYMQPIHALCLLEITFFLRGLFVLSEKIEKNREFK